jgi:hypothetical protein
MNTDFDAGPDTSPDGELVRLLPTDERDMTPSAVLWAKIVLKALRAFPRAQMYRPARESLTAVVWTLAAAADFNNTISADLRATVLAREAGVGDRVWQNAPPGCASTAGSNTASTARRTDGDYAPQKRSERSV